jgi:hypothetical protein
VETKHPFFVAGYTRKTQNLRARYYSHHSVRRIEWQIAKVALKERDALGDPTVAVADLIEAHARFNRIQAVSGWILRPKHSTSFD